MSRPKLLVIQPYGLIPTDSGGKNRALHTITELSKYYSLHLVYFYHSPEEKKLTQAFLDKLSINSTPIPAKPKAHFSFITSGIPYWFSDWAGKEALRQVAQISLDYPHILIEYSQLLHLVDVVPKNSRVIFTAYDTASVTFYRRFRQEKNLLKQIIALTRLVETFLYERRYLPQYHQVIAVSSADAAIIDRLFSVKSTIIDNGIDQIRFLPPLRTGDVIRLGYIGSDTHPPNLQAINFLVKSISPALTKRGVRHQIILAGNHSQTNQGQLVNWLGYIDDVADFYRSIDVLVAPISAASGSRIKILESLSYAIPVITTLVGAEGLTINSPYLNIITRGQEANQDTWVDAIRSVTANSPNAFSQNELRRQLTPITWNTLFARHHQIFANPTHR